MEVPRRSHRARRSLLAVPERTMFVRHLSRRLARRLLCRAVPVLALVAALCLPAAAPAHAESGAHRHPPAPPVHIPVGVGERN